MDETDYREDYLTQEKQILNDKNIAYKNRLGAMAKEFNTSKALKDYVTEYYKMNK